MPAFLILLMNRELKTLTPCSISAVLMTSKTPFLSRPLGSFCYDTANKGDMFSEGLILSCKKIDISVIYY
jgi:hypothetical protein